MTEDELEREARRILEPLRYSPVAVATPREIEAGRTASVPELARLIKGVPQKRALLLRRQRRVVWLRYAAASALAVAAAAVLYVAARQQSPAQVVPSPQLVVVDGQLSHKGTALSTGVKYAIGTLGRLSTPASGGAKFVTNEGVRIGFDADSTVDLSFAGDTRRITLNRGKIKLSVPKLALGTSLSVTTPDAVVTVHGTRFSVEIRDTITCVRVTEGLVSVARGAQLEQLSSGEASGCEELHAALVDRVTPDAAEASPEPNTSVEVSRPKAKGAGTLTQENRLFRSALAAEQAGNLARAGALATRLLTRYPNSPMAPDAHRILKRLKEKQSETTRQQ